MQMGAAAAALIAVPSRLRADQPPGAGPAPLVPPAAEAKLAPAKAVRALSFVHTHTAEKLAIEYCCDGKYDPKALEKLN